MAILVTADVPGQTAQGYDSMLGMLANAVKQAPGFVLHTAHPIEGGWRILEVWESQNDASQFFAKYLHPNLPPGVKPKRTVHPKPPAGPGELAEETPEQPPGQTPDREPKSKPPAGPGTFPAPKPEENGRSQASFR